MSNPSEENTLTRGVYRISVGVSGEFIGECGLIFIAELLRVAQSETSCQLGVLGR